MDHRDALATLTDTDRIELQTRRNGPALLRLALNIALIALCTWAIATKQPFWGVALAVQAVLLTFLFTLEHECTHKTAFAHGPLNEWVGKACGYVLILPFERFRAFHMAHHRHTGNAAEDPELAHPKPDTTLRFLWHVSGLPYWLGQLKSLALAAIGRDKAAFLTDRTRPRVIREAQEMVGVYVAVALFTWWFSPVFLWVWLLPVALGQPLLRLYLLAEHGLCPKVPNLLLSTRTVFTNPLMRFLAWNMPYHAEHHMMPNVPFHQLPKAHSLLKSHLGCTEKSYLGFTGKYLKEMGKPD
ncbi:MAG: fatty acid desaturase [Brevirhabdus sp.]